MVDIYPEGHRIIIKPDEIEEVSNGGIILLQDTTDREMRASNVGTVYKVGPTADCRVCPPGEDPRNIREGDRVIFVRNSYAATKPERHSKDEYWFINDEDIMGLVK